MLTAKENQINRKIMIIRAGLTQKQLADRLSVNSENQRISRQAVNNELRGVYHSERVRLGICDIIGVSKEEFWPEFYGPECERNVNSHTTGINENVNVVN